jgi:hypothetical protein
VHASHAYINNHMDTVLENDIVPEADRYNRCERPRENLQYLYYIYLNKRRHINGQYYSLYYNMEYSDFKMLNLVVHFDI